MRLLDSIKDNFNKGYNRKAMLIQNLSKEFPAWTIKASSWVGVAVPIDSFFEFKESFAEVILTTEKNFSIADNTYNILLLKCTSLDYLDQFAILCENFVEIGENGVFRKNLINSPKEWWNNWKNLLGNKSQTKEPYAILGELLTYRYLAKEGYIPIWSGAERGSHDLETDTFSVEVKSTTSRYEYDVTINSIYQLRLTNNKPLYLSFIRFEESNLGCCIDEVVNELNNYSLNIDLIEKKLEKYSLEKGRTARHRKYKIIEWKKYTVDEKFPTITEHSFKQDCIPKNIVRLNYTINLSSLNGENLLI